MMKTLFEAPQLPPVPEGLIRPSSLIEGSSYLLEDSRDRRRRRVLSPVQFIKYDASPAFVIIEHSDGRRTRSPREVLWSIE